MTRSLVLVPLENLKGYAISRPPIIVFIVCIGVIAIILMTLAFYVSDNELETSDLTQDWNVFLESFSDVDFCIQNGTFINSNFYQQQPIHLPLVTTMSSSSGLIGSTPATDALRNYSISMMLDIQPTPEFLSIPHNLTVVSGTIRGSELGLKGLAGEEKILVSSQLPFNWNSSQCSTSSLYGLTCNLIHIYTCVTFQASALVFPLGRRPPTCQVQNSTGIEYYANLRGHNPKIFSIHHPKIVYPLQRCYLKPMIHINYKLDSTFTILLSLSDRSLINLHLLHTSYFLFVMTITILIYAMVRGRQMKLKLTNSVSLPLTANTDI